MTDSKKARAGQEATLSQEFVDFLTELSIGVHRFAIYPRGHPSMAPAVARILARLQAILLSRRRLVIGIARERLVIDDVSSDPKHPVLSDLAKRLHDHQLAGLWFSAQVQPSEIESFLLCIAEEANLGVGPIGLRPQEKIPSWPNAGFSALAYSDLILRDSDEPIQEGPATSLWLALAKAVIPESAEPGATPLQDGSAIAKAIQQAPNDPEFDQVVAGSLRRITEELRAQGGAGNERIRAEVTRLIHDLDDEALARLMEFSDRSGAQRQFLLDANESLAVDAVVRMLETASKTSKQTISKSMTRLLSKLALHAEVGRGTLRTQADYALRENVEELVNDWHLTDPNPEQYTAILDAMSRSDPEHKDVSGPKEWVTSAQRMVEMALEVDGYGPSVERSVHKLLLDGNSRLLLDRVVRAEDNEVSKRIWKLLATPAYLAELLTGGEVDRWALEQVVNRLGTSAIDPLLEVLIESDSRMVRRAVFDALVGMGEPVKHRALERLDDERWFVLRNLLALLSVLGPPPAGFDPAEYTWHPDQRVRRQAFVLALKDPRHRDWALAEAISGDDERLVRMALDDVAAAGLPEALVPTLISRVLYGDHPSEMRGRAAYALESSRSLLVRDALIGSAEEKGLFGRVRLGPSSPAVVAAISVLARHWRGDEDADRILERASRAKDEELRAAAEEGAAHGG